VPDDPPAIPAPVCYSLLCNGGMAFEDTGVLLPGGPVIELGRSVRWADAMGVTQAGHGRTAAPVSAGRARDGGLRWPGPVMAGAALVTSPPGMLPGPRRHAAWLRRWRAPTQAVRPAAGRQERMTADAR
jgi:hypothetical protein